MVEKGAKEKLFPGVHPNALKCVSDNPVYVTAGLQEYQILQDGPAWRIKRYPRGRLNPAISGHFTSFKLAEDALIRFIKRKDKWGRAMYPGKKFGKSEN